MREGHGDVHGHVLNDLVQVPNPLPLPAANSMSRSFLCRNDNQEFTPVFDSISFAPDPLARRREGTLEYPIDAASDLKLILDKFFNDANGSTNSIRHHLFTSFSNDEVGRLSTFGPEHE